MDVRKVLLLICSCVRMFRADNVERVRIKWWFGTDEDIIEGFALKRDDQGAMLLGRTRS